MKKLFLFAILFAACATASAQDNYRKLRIAADYGMSYQTKKFPSSNFAWGHGLAANASYFLNKNWGVGLDMHWMQYQSDTKTYERGASETLKTITEDTDAKLLFAGPSAFYRINQRNEKGALLIGLAGGYLDFKDKFNHKEGDMAGEDLKLKGHGLAGKIFLGYDFYVSPSSAIGLMVSYTFGEMTNGRMSNLTTPSISYPKDVKRNLGHLNITLGYRFGK